MDKFRSELAAWTAIYQKYFGITPEWPEVDLDKYDPKLYFLIAVAKNISMNNVLDKMECRFSVFPIYHNLDQDVPKHERMPDDSYIVLAARSVEADPELACMPVRDLDNTLGFQGITLLERMLLELYYYESTGEHLDRETINLCSGSRDFQGDIIGVQFTDIGFVFDYYEQEEFDYHIRSRRIYLPVKKASV